jgi:hypothetical protein
MKKEKLERKIFKIVAKRACKICNKIFKNIIMTEEIKGGYQPTKGQLDDNNPPREE